MEAIFGHIVFPFQSELAKGKLFRSALGWGQLLVLIVLLPACATRSYQPVDVQSAGFLERSVTQTIGDVRVTAAVPDAQETLALTGLDLYEQGIQPVWLKVENNSAEPVRIAIWSVDPQYFSPLEVAYMNRKQYGKEGYADAERWFNDNGIERRVPVGETRAGLVFTNLKPGTKGFNLDVFGGARPRNFTFFVPMPGFTADYMAVGLAALYGESDFQTVDRESLRQLLENDLPCCAMDQSGDAQGEPLNLVIVGSRLGIRRALMRAAWQETAVGSLALAAARTQYLFGRPPDGTFVWPREDGAEKVEMRLWLAPFRVGEDSVWIGQAGYRIPDPDHQGKDVGLNFTPDIDNARRFVFQKFWYSQVLTHLGMTGGVNKTTREAPGNTFNGTQYFTDGDRVVIFVSESPVAFDEAELIYKVGHQP